MTDVTAGRLARALFGATVWCLAGGSIAELRSVVSATVQPNHVALWIADR